MINDLIAFDGLYKWFINEYEEQIRKNYGIWALENIGFDNKLNAELEKIFFIGTIDNANSNIARYLLFKYGISFINQVEIDILKSLKL